MIIDIDIDIDIDTDLEPTVSARNAAVAPGNEAGLEREFAAIMTLAGFGDRVVAAALAPRGLESGESPSGLTVHVTAAATSRDSSHGARVRSPPALGDD